MKFILTLFAFAFLISSSSAYASGVFPNTIIKESFSIVKSEKGKVERKKAKKKSPNKKKCKDKNAILPFILWWILAPICIAAIIALAFILPLPILWYIGLGLFTVWAGVSGIVFFPIQYIGLPLGMAVIIYGLITGAVLIWTAGIALVFAAFFAFAFMALMFTIGTRKNQPK